jgi:cell division septation protein DedD
MSDEGFHEIQLNGKQLVFLFMAATVVSVVIFLCGVMVGRGVPDRSAVAATESAGTTSDGAPGESASARPAPEPVGTRGSGQQAHQTEQAPSPAQQTPVSTAASPPADQAPPEPAPDHDYFDDLVNGQKDTRVGTATGRAAGAPPKQREPAPVAKTPASAAAKPAAAPAAVVERTSSSSGYAVQLAAVRERSEADGIARRLVSKGYQAYVLVPQPGKPPVYRVQVGRFKTRSEADKIAARLRKNEQFKPWVTR